MRRVIIFLLTVLLYGQAAAFSGLNEITGWPVLWWPKNKSDDLALKAGGAGAGGRLSWNLGMPHGFAPSLFTEFAYFKYDAELVRIPFETQPGGNGVNIDNGYNMYTAGSGITLEFHKYAFRPYCEISGGFIHYSNTYRIDNRVWIGEPIDRTVSVNKSTSYYEIGGGLKFLMWSSPAESQERPSREVLLDFKGGYLRGGKAAFLSRNSAHLDETNSLAYAFVNTSLSLYQFRLGVNVIL